jgi:hypothetical protein
MLALAVVSETVSRGTASKVRIAAANKAIAAARNKRTRIRLLYLESE